MLRRWMCWAGGLLVALPLIAQVPQVKINEVFYDPATGQGEEPEGEWVELYNAGSAPVDLSLWIFTDDTGYAYNNEGNFTIPNGTQIDPGGFLILCNDSDTFVTYWTVPPGVPIVPYGAFDQGIIQLNNTGDDVHLFMPDGQGGYTLVDEMWYGSGSGNTGNDMGSTNAAPDVPAGHSLARTPNGYDTDTPSNDFQDQASPTPGSSNPTTVFESTDLPMHPPGIRWFPAMGLLQWPHPLSTPFHLYVYRSNGQRIGHLKLPAGTRQIQIAPLLSSSGVYFLRLGPKDSPEATLKILWMPR